uniref:Sulfotransferase family protein n=1 Tax=Candidatus Kentrum sp. FW TaxID=2126338 RepID=A0A450SFT5_9GAMM|nr:MAG: hypothetical protein BECKFW1821B_GA0114236_101020 [Candidatus Kentron sp. FW]
MPYKNRVLVNSLPKGGPHLLKNIIEAFGYEAYSGKSSPNAFNYKEVKKALKIFSKSNGEKIALTPFSPWYVDEATVRHWLDVVLWGQYIPGHVPWCAELSSVLTDLDYRHILIIRDPRLLISDLIFGGSIMPRFLTDDFEQLSLKKRLGFMLDGGNVPKTGIELNDFATVYRSMLAWSNDPNCLLVRFEDVSVKDIASYLDVPVNDDAFTEFEKNDVFNEWMDTVDTASLARITAYCEQLCHEAGYEADESWMRSE